MPKSKLLRPLLGRKKGKKYRQLYLVSETFDSTASATCQSSNKFGYSVGSAKDSAAFWLTCIIINGWNRSTPDKD